MIKGTGWILTFLLWVSPAFAALQDDLRNDSAKVAEWFSGELADTMAFDSSVSPILPADVLELGKVEIGIAGHGSASKFHRDTYRNLPVTALDVKSTELPDTIGGAGGTLYGKVGLPFGLDLGAKLGALKAKDKGIEVNNTLFGFELRKRLMGGGVAGAAKPDIALSIGYDGAKGDATRTEHYTGTLINGSTLDADSRWRAEWNVGAISAKGTLSKTVSIFTPYVGLGFLKFVGDTTTVNTLVGTSSSGNVSETARGAGNADKGLVTLFFGGDVAFVPFFHLNLGVTLANEHTAAFLGLRFRI